MRLKELRTCKGVTQKEVAEAIGCSANNYARYEREEREPDISTLKLISDYFGVGIDYIVCNDRFCECVN
jgi:transcriptional regulator with XRE-family HTH domain